MATNIPSSPQNRLEGPYSAARKTVESSVSFPPIGPPAPPHGTDRLILIRRSVLVALVEHETGAITEAIDALDLADGDPDFENATDVEDEAIQPHLLESGEPGCPVGDHDGPAAPEWTSLGRFKDRPLTQLPDEDAEQDDTPEDDDADSCGAYEDQGGAIGGDDGRPGDADDAEPYHDAEEQQMLHDVPVLQVFAPEPNIFTGKREFLGMNNLQPSFVGGGGLKAI